MEKPNILIGVGSPSDFKKYFKDVTLDDRANYFLSVASTHRVPELVERHTASQHWDGIVACAGLTNGRLGQQLSLANEGEIIVGVPLGEYDIKGLASFLSSTEFPQGYPAAATKLNDIGSALRHIVTLTTTQFDHVVLMHNSKSDNKRVAATKSSLGAVGIPCAVIYVYSEDTLAALTRSSKKYQDENGLFIAVLDDELPYKFNPPLSHLKNIDPLIIISYDPKADPSKYFDVVKGASDNILFLGTDQGENLVLYTASVLAVRNTRLKEKIREKRLDGRKKYDDYPNVLPLPTTQSLKDIITNAV